MPYVDYCKLCGTPIRFEGQSWVHYRDLDHAPQVVHVRIASPADSISEALKRDEVSVSNILRLATICAKGNGSRDDEYDLIAMLMTDPSITLQFMLDDSIDDSYKIECLFLLDDLDSQGYALNLFGAMWRSDKLSDAVRSILGWMNDVRHIPIKTPTDKLLDAHGW